MVLAVALKQFELMIKSNKDLGLSIDFSGPFLQRMEKNQ